MTAGALMLYVASGKTSKNLKIYEIPEKQAFVCQAFLKMS